MSKETTAVSNKEPLMHISKRDEIDMWKAWAVRLGAVLLSLVVCAGVIYALTGLNPLEVYKGIFDGAVGTKRRTWMTIRDTLVLLCIAIGITPAFKMRFWNIGAEGQVLIGGVTSAAMMIYLGNSLPPLVLFPLMLLGSALSAMVWAAIPAFFKAYWNTNETLFTLMMNYVAMQVITYCIIFWENPKGSNSVGTINSTTKGGWLPKLFGLEYGWNLVIVLALTLAICTRDHPDRTSVPARLAAGDLRPSSYHGSASSMRLPWFWSHFSWYSCRREQGRLPPSLT